MDAQRRKTVHDAMVRMSDGDRSAIQTLVDELWPAIFDFARRGVQHEADAEDVAQEVFLRICSRISDFDRNRDGLSWAFGIAAYEVMTHRRRRARRRETSDGSLEDHVDPGASQEDTAIQRDLVAALTEAVGELSAQERSNLGLPSACAPVNVGGAALRKRRQRSLDRLRTLWRRLYGEP